MKFMGQSKPRACTNGHIWTEVKEVLTGKTHRKCGICFKYEILGGKDVGYNSRNNCNSGTTNICKRSKGKE
jgi:hypothetical protein